MTWLPLESKVLASVAYDADRRSYTCASARRAMCIATLSSPPLSIRRSSTPTQEVASSSHIRDHHAYERMAKFRAA